MRNVCERESRKWKSGSGMLLGGGGGRMEVGRGGVRAASGTSFRQDRANQEKNQSAQPGTCQHVLPAG